MNGKQLKNSILQWAIQGKLVPQNPKDEPASKLLERIAAQRVIASGAKQSKKNLASRIYREGSSWFEQVGSAQPKDITEEIPFDIPESWEWCSLESVCADIADIDHKMPSVCENGIPYVSPLNFRPNNVIDFDSAKKISRTDFEQLSKKCKPERGDIIFPRYGTIGVIRTVETDIDFLVSYSCATIKPLHDFVLKEYVGCVLQSSLIQLHEIPRYINKTTQPNVGLQSIKRFLFPLAPLAEQKRIVKKLEQILPLVDEYDQAQTQLDKLNKELPEALKKSILQQAIQGKLVPQNPKDEPADKLLERITISRHSEHSEESSKKSRKSSSKNPVSRIYRDTDGLWYEQTGSSEPIDISEEIPFEIPETWTWCRLQSIVSKLVDGDHNPPAGMSNKTKYLMLSSRNINDDKLVDLDKVRYLTEDLFTKENERTNAQKGDILFTSVGTIGRSCILSDELHVCFQRSVTIMTTDIYNEYLKRVFDSPFYQSYAKEHAIGTAQLGFYLKEMAQSLIPLPPLAEQKRIVAKLEQIFKVL